MKKCIFVALIIGFMSQISYGQDLDNTKLDNYFRVLEENNKFMGSVAVSQCGKIIYTKSVGFSDFENKFKANETTKYRIGSISKTFTSVLVLKAIEENKLELNHTIDGFFPTIKNASKITIKDMLNHRSGIHNFTDNDDFLSWHTQAKTEEEMVEIIARGGSDFEPDRKSEYSNSNFVLLTYILEKVFKNSYSELLKKNITDPLGLESTYLGSRINTSKKECKSYSYIGTWKAAPETDISIPLGAGGIVSTPTDLVKFSDALFGGKLLTPRSLEIMKTITEDYGIGLFQTPFYDKIGYGHTGGIDEFSSVFLHYSDGNISYALTSNGKNIKNKEISDAVLSAIYNKPFDIPEFSCYEVSAEDLDKYLGVYSSEQIPLKILVTMENNVLLAQASGQPSFPLEATEKDKFKFDQAGIVLEFNPTEKKMILKQRGSQFAFTKE